jgi:hypothetical protein
VFACRPRVAPGIEGLEVLNIVGRLDIEDIRRFSDFRRTGLGGGRGGFCLPFGEEGGEPREGVTHCRAAGHYSYYSGSAPACNIGTRIFPFVSKDLLLPYSI